jgi:DNA polymerase III subunit beta
VNLSIDAPSLDNALRTALRATSATDVVLSGDSDTLTVQASDQATVIEIVVPATVSSPGRLVLPGRLLAALVAKCVGPLTIDATATTAIVTVAGVTSSLNVLDPQSVPSFPPAPDPSIELDGPTLAAAVRAVAPAVSTDQNRAALTGLFIELIEGEVHVTATDTYRLATDTQPGPSGEFSAVVPPSALAVFSKIDEGQVKVSLTTPEIILSHDNVTVRARLVSGEYPAYRTLLANVGDQKITLPTEQVIDLLSRVAPTANAQRTVTLTISATELVASTSGEYGTSRGSLVLDGTAHDFEFALNIDFLTDALKIMGDVTVISHGDPRRAVLLSSSTPTQCLLMPLRTG